MPTSDIDDELGTKLGVGVGWTPEAYRFALLITAAAVAMVGKTNPIAANPSGP